MLNDFVMPTESKPTSRYMYWYRSVTTEILSEPKYLVDPHQQASSSNAKQNQQHIYTQLPTQQNYQPTNTETKNQYLPHKNHKTKNIPVEKGTCCRANI